VDSGSIDTFTDYSFASKTNCLILLTAPRTIKVAGGGHLDTSAITESITYLIQNEAFQNEFKLLPLKSYDIILGCDWIKQHSPIGLDLRDTSRQLIIRKNGLQKLFFEDFTSPPPKPLTSAAKLEKICRGRAIELCHPN
jgi:hypothetical protein